MSKMGISVLDSYRAAQLFDVLGLDAEVTDCASPAPHPHGWPELRRHRSRAAFLMDERSPKVPSCPTTDGCASAAPKAPSLTPGSPSVPAICRLAVGAARANTQAATTLAPAEAWSAYARAADEARASRPARSVAASIRPAPSSNSTKSSRRQAWSSASSPAPCHWVRSAPRRTRPSPSR